MNIISYYKLLKSWIWYRIVNPYVDKRLWKFEDWHISKYQNRVDYDIALLQNFFPLVQIEGDFDQKDIIAKHEIDLSSCYKYSFDIPTVLESKYYYLINAESRKIIKRSRHNCFDPWAGDAPVPSLWYYYFPARRIPVQKAIIITNSLWFNYYHFFFDVLSQVVVLNKFGIDRTIPIIAPIEIDSVNYIQQFKEISSLLNNQTFLFIKANDKVIIQEEAIVVKDSYMNYETINTILNSIDLTKIDSNNTPKYESVFITRNSKRTRGITNINQIEAIAKQLGFEIIDTDGWSLQNQISLFRNVKNVIGIHGAGLTNIIFGGEKLLNVFEIMPGDLTPAFYQHISSKLKYNYHKISGNNRAENQNFFLDPKYFESEIKQFFKL